jgi:protease IV
MWREIKKLAMDKPLVATMGDVAASGGYYMSMAAPTVLAHPLTITGSIGVVTGKFNLEELYDRVLTCLLSLQPSCHALNAALSKGK